MPMDPLREKEYRAVREGAVWRLLDSRRQLAVTGPDSVSFLHAMLSNEVQSLADQTGRYGTLLTATGKIVADFYYYRLPGEVLIDVELEVMEDLKAALESHIIMDEVEVEDRSAGMSQVGLDGPEAGALLESLLGRPLPEEPLSLLTVEWKSTPVLVVRKDALGVPGYEVLLSTAKLDEWLSSVVDAGASAGLCELSPAVFDLLRLEAGVPLFGRDFNQRNNPLEARLESAYSLTKGCYPGQELVARATHIGGVARLLSKLQLEGSAVPEPETPVFNSDGKEIGWITSAGFSPRFGRVISLGYLKRIYSEAGRIYRLDPGDGVMRNVEVVDRFS